MHSTLITSRAASGDEETLNKNEIVFTDEKEERERKRRAKVDLFRKKTSRKNLTGKGEQKHRQRHFHYHFLVCSSAVSSPCFLVCRVYVVLVYPFFLPPFSSIIVDVG
jgi:hypothetical protein